MKFHRNRRRHAGMVLITSLIILLVLTLLGLASIQNTSLEERMAGNLRRENIAFQAAESALRAGENWLFLLTAPPTVGKFQDGRFIWGYGDEDTATSPEKIKNDAATSWWREWGDTEWNNNAYTTAIGEDLQFTAEGGVLPARPRYLIQERGLYKDSLVVGQQQDISGGGRTFYEVTARGLDSTGRSEVILRSTYARRF
jgi:type IV pilus assembly protein PilX